jgi:hypothetical protein
MGVTETQVGCSARSQRSDLHIRIGLLIRRFGFESPGAHGSTCGFALEPPHSPTELAKLWADTEEGTGGQKVAGSSLGPGPTETAGTASPHNGEEGGRRAKR